MKTISLNSVALDIKDNAVVWLMMKISQKRTSFLIARFSLETRKDNAVLRLIVLISQERTSVRSR